MGRLNKYGYSAIVALSQSYNGYQAGCRADLWKNEIEHDDLPVHFQWGAIKPYFPLNTNSFPIMLLFIVPLS